MGTKEVSDRKIDEAFFHNLRYIETNMEANKLGHRLSCTAHLANQEVEIFFVSMKRLCQTLANKLKELKGCGQMANDFHLYKVGKYYLINPEYLVCLHPKEKEKHVWIGHNDPTLKFDELKDIPSDTLRGLKCLLIPEERDKYLARQKAQVESRKAQREQRKHTISMQRSYPNDIERRFSGCQTISFLVTKDFDEPSYYSPEDFNDDVCVI